MANENAFEVRRVRIDTLTIFEVSESELEAIERGAPDSVLLTFSVFLISVAISFSITLATTTITSTRTFAVFVVFTTIGYLFGIMLFLFWLRSHASIKSITQKIRERSRRTGEQIQ